MLIQQSNDGCKHSPTTKRPSTEAGLTLRDEAPLVGFKFGDQEPDPFKDLLVKHVQRHLSIVCDPLVQLVALITYPPTPNEH